MIKYENIYSNSPLWVKYPLKKTTDLILGKPQVNQKKNTHKIGRVVISADFELAWAFRYSKSCLNPIEKAIIARKNIPQIIKYSELFNIPITWATVGHLFLESCNRGDHDWMRKIPYFDNHWLYNKGDWFDHDPYGNWEDNKAWYAPDLIEKILNSKVNHEIACHSFTHINCRDNVCPKNVLKDELKAWQNGADRWGVKASSFVFPGGTYGNFDVLKEYGYKIYRRKMKFQLDNTFIDNNDLLVTTSTSAFTEPEFPINYYVSFLKRAISKAIKTKTICHIWFHPSVSKATVEEVMLPIFKFINKQREAGILEVKTMQELL